MSDAGSDIEAGGGDGTRDFTEVTNQNYLSKMKTSCTGVCIGFLLFFGSIGLLVWNEGRTVKRAKDIDEGRENVVFLNLEELSVSNTTDLTEFEGKLVHVTGPLTTSETLVDPIFGASFGESSMQGNETNVTTTTVVETESALKLFRSVEVYQWVESSTSRQVKSSGGGTRTVTDYKYSKKWSTSLISSSSFKEQSTSRINPLAFPFEQDQFTADPILLSGRIELVEQVIDRFNWFEPLNDVSVDDVVDEDLRQNLTEYQSNGLYYGNGMSSTPQVGDTRITFSYVEPDTISIVALYTDENSLDSYTTTRGGTLLLVQRGTVSSEDLFKQADDENTTLSWILRFVGFALQVIAILLILQPIATAVDIIPGVGSLIGDGMEKCLFPLIAFIIAIPVCAFTISLAWIAYRPVVAVPILVVSGGLVVWLFVRHRKKQSGSNNVGSQQQQPIKVETPYSSSVPTAQVIPYTASPYSASTPTATGGFAGALDAPPPPVTTNPPATTSDYEPDINTSDPPKYESEINTNEPFVPNVFKP